MGFGHREAYGEKGILRNHWCTAAFLCVPLWTKAFLPIVAVFLGERESTYSYFSQGYFRRREKWTHWV